LKASLQILVNENEVISGTGEDSTTTAVDDYVNPNKDKPIKLDATISIDDCTISQPFWNDIINEF
jgi:hypothetical protein